MAMHAHHRREPQATGDRDRDFNTDQSIVLSGQPTALTGPIATADITTYTTSTGAFEFETTVNGVGTTMTSTGEVVITDSAEFASITSAEAASRAAQSSSRTTSAAAETSSASSGGSDNNLATLIPAIVVPVVVVLLASFGGFWWWMRRRHRRELKNTDFAMAGKGEKLTSRSNSSRAGASPPSEKNANATVTEVAPHQPYSSDHPKDSFEAIGLARGPNPYDSAKQGSRPQSPKMPFGGGRDGPRERDYHNFSGPRPQTAGRPPPSHGPPQGRDRSNSSPGNRGPPPGARPWQRPGPGQGQRGPPQNRDIGPSPIMRNHASPPLGSGQPPHSPHSQPRPAPAPPMQGKIRAASPTSGLGRTNAPTAIAPPPGAYNGASPISQYSPIVKDTPNIGTVASFGNSPPRNISSRDGSRPPPIITTDIGTGLGVGAIAVSKENSRSTSPRSPEESFLTEENMRIARLANSSRLGFNQTSKPGSPGPNVQRPVADFSKPLGYKRNVNNGQSSPLLPINTAHSAPGQSPAATSVSNPSPKLPPPATLSQLIPSDSPRDERKPQWNYFGSGQGIESPTSSVYSGVLTGHARPLPSNARSNLHHDNRDDDQKSEVSDLDAYEDIDAKSDVSSLNEFERFDFDSRSGSRPTSSSVRGMGR